MNKKNRSTVQGSLGSIGEDLMAPKIEQAGIVLHSCKVNQEPDCFQAQNENFLKPVKILNANKLAEARAVGEAQEDFHVGQKTEIMLGEG